MSDLPVTVDLSAYRGDSTVKTFRFVKNGSPVDLSEVTVKSSALHISTLTDTPLGVVKEPDPGVITLELPLDILSGSYKYDVKMVDTNDKVTTWIKGKLQIERDVTHVP